LLIEKEATEFLRNVKLKPKCFKDSSSVHVNDRLFEIVINLDQELGCCHFFTQTQTTLLLSFEKTYQYQIKDLEDVRRV
jgi:hypothetical protein